MTSNEQEKILSGEDIFKTKKAGAIKNNVFNKVLLFIVSLLEKYTDINSKVNSKEANSDSMRGQKENVEILPLTPNQIKADQFIAIKEYSLLEKMVKNGYELLPVQTKLVEDYIGTLLTAYDNKGSILQHHNTIENWLSLGIKLKEKSIEMYFYQRLNERKKIDRHDRLRPYQSDFHELYPLSFFYETDENMKSKINGQVVENILLTSHLKDYVKNNNIFYELFVSLIKNLEEERSYDDYYSKKESKSLLSEILTDDRKDLLLQELDFEKFLEIITTFNSKTEDKEYQEIKTKLQDILKTHYKNNLKEVINNVKHNYSSVVIEKLVIENVKNDTQHISINKLPNEAKDILEEINVLYKKIQESNIQPTETELFNVNNLLQKRIPEILKKYLTIDEQYQTTLIHSNGKNAQELMIDSLNNIYSNFLETWKNINGEALSSLSATNRYTKTFKK